MWKILQILSEGDLITAARYFCAATKDDNKVETEGWCHFHEPEIKIPFSEVTEEAVISWVEGQIGEQVKNRLEEQLEALAKQKSVVAPWLPQVFTPDI